MSFQGKGMIAINNLALARINLSDSMWAKLEVEEASLSPADTKVCCTGCTAYLFEQGKQVGLCCAPKVTIDREKKVGDIEGSVTGSYGDITFFGNDASCDFGQQYGKISHGVVIKHPQGVVQAPSMRIDLQAQEIFFDDGIETILYGSSDAILHGKQLPQQ